MRLATRTDGATSAPLVVKDRILVGTSGGDDGVRGFIAAFDATTGAERWRTWTIPAPGEFGSQSWPRRHVFAGVVPQPGCREHSMLS